MDLRDLRPLVLEPGTDLYLDGGGVPNEITQVRELLDPVDLTGAVVTGDAAHAQRETAAYIAGPPGDGGRGAGYYLFVKGNQPGLQQAVSGAIQQRCPREPDHAGTDYGHGRIIRRSLWVTSAAGLDFPHASQAIRIRRDGKYYLEVPESNKLLPEADVFEAMAKEKDIEIISS